MDVRFTNVLEGARQYFQGLPTGTNSMVSHAYPSEGHQRSDVDQAREPPPSSSSYWPPQATEPAQGPASHESEYVQNVSMDHGRVQYPGTGPYQDQYHQQQQQSQQQNFQFPRPHSREAPSNNQSQYQSHIPSNSPYIHQIPSPNAKPQTSSAQYQSLGTPYHKLPTATVKTPTGAAQYQSHIPMSPSYQQLSSPTVKPPTSTTQYQSHIPANTPYHQSPSPTIKPPSSSAPYQYHQTPSPYHQPPSPFHQVPSPQLPRVPSREQLIPRAPSNEQNLYRSSSQEQLAPRVPSREQQTTHYPQTSETYNNYPQARPYYPVQSQAKTIPTNNTYKTVTSSQSYPTSSQQHNTYYKNIYSSQAQTSHQAVYSNTKSGNTQQLHEIHHQPLIRNDNSEQVFRTTHNLPPIAAISNYHSSRTVREPNKPVTTSTRARTLSSSSYTSNNNPTMVSSNSSIIQQAPVRSPYTQTTASSCYLDQTSYSSQQQQQQYQYTTTATTQSYNHVIMTSSNSTSNYYSASNQNQSSSQQYYQQPNKSNSQVVPRSQPLVNQQPPPVQNPAEHNLNGRLVVKRESPLDLSVKTVRTPADSTLGDAENEARNKLYQTNRAVQSTISTHNYPQLDMNSFQRNLSQRASQLPSATAPKVEFRPNFNVPSLNQPLRQPPPRRPVEDVKRNVSPEKAHSNSRPVYDTKNTSFQNISAGRYSNVTIPSAAHINSYVQSQQVPPKVLMNSIPKMPLSNSSPSYTNTMYAVPPTEVQKKRPADVCPPIIPNKVPKVDNWRHTIDLQIEERLSSYKQQQAKVILSPNAPKTINGAYTSINSDRSKDMYPPYQKPSYENYAQNPSFNMQYQTHPNHNQTYVPSPATHQVPGYTGYTTQHSHPGNSYLQPSSRSNSSSSLNTLPNTKINLGGAVDKRVLSLLKNSLEVKGRKKLEQQKSHENFTQHPRSDVQHPSTDVTAPLQPKPGLIGRNNVSPFTPTSFPDNSNMYKFHIPKAIDSVNFENNKTLNPILDKQTLDTVITNHSSLNPDYDGLAAFLAARIRTKGELKQGGSTNQNISNNNTSNEGQLRNIIENQLKSPTKQEIVMQNSSSSGTTSSGTPPKLQKDRPTVVAPRKRLFSRNEDDVNNTTLPPRDKSGLRSSSETSVFDFPDSDSENDIIGRESLEAMRKGRRSSKQGVIPMIDIKVESSPRPLSPDDDVFAKLCDNFVEELKNNSAKKKYKKKKGMEAEVLAKLETVTKENPIESEKEIVFKQEIDGLIEIKGEEQEEVSKYEEVPKAFEIKQELQDTVEAKPVVTDDKLIIENEIQSHTLEIKNKDPVFIEKQHNVKRRLVSSSESDSDAEIKNRNIEKESKSVDPQNISVENKEESAKVENKEIESPQKEKDPPMARPAKKPSFGDGSDFYPGWEEGVYKYKKALRMPPSLIQVSRPPQFHRLSTSLPDLDPYPQSPTTSIVECTEKETSGKTKFKKIKSENLDSDNESNSSFNLFTRKTNYDSEGSASVRSLPNTAMEMSILDRLLEKCGGKKKRKYKRKDDHSPKIIPKAESAIELLPTPSLEIKEEKDKEVKKLASPVIKSESALLGFRKKTINNFKDAFIKSANSIVGINEQFTTVVLKSRTRKETRVLKQRATIKEVFGEDRPASAPPVTCVNDIQIKDDLSEDSNRLGNLVIKLEKRDNIIDKVIEDQKEEVLVEKENELTDTKQMLKNKLLTKGKKKENNLLKTLVDKKIKIEIQDEMEDDTRSLEDIVIKRDPDDKSETPSIDGDDSSVTGRRRNKFGKMRRKLSSGFDYIRKKKKIKKENIENENTEKKKKKTVVSKTPESIDDIQKEIKSWVLNKGIGESHLHRAARLGYTDVMAYCLENMKSNPSPKDNAGYTPLHVACSRGHLEIAKLLLLYGANPSESAQGGIRPLHEAVENGFVEVTRLLLSYGADPTLATYSGLTPLALTNDEITKQFLKNHLNDIEGEPSDTWQTHGPASVFDPINQIGFNILDESPEADPPTEEEDVDFEVSESLLPNLYTLQGESPTDRFVLLQDLSNILKIKSRDALLRQICPPSTSSTVVNYKSILRELKMSDFLEQARCCQFLNAGEKINTRASKIALVKYTDKVRELLGVENVLITNR